jgi:hypothetical protein
MRYKLFPHLAQHGPDELDELPLEAIESLSVGPIARKPREPAGGDAG